MPQINNSTTQHIVQPGIHKSDDNDKQHKKADTARFGDRQISVNEPTKSVSVRATKIAKAAKAFVISKVPGFLLRQRKVEITTPVSSLKVQQPVNVDKQQESGHQIRPERPLPKPPGDNSDNPTSHPVSKKSRPLPPPPGDNSDNPTSHPVSKNSRPLPPPPGKHNKPSSKKTGGPLPPLVQHSMQTPKSNRLLLPPLKQYKRPLPELPVDNSDQMPDESLTMVTTRSGNTLPTATTETWQAAGSTGDDTLYQDIREQYADQLADLEGTNDSGYQMTIGDDTLHQDIREQYADQLANLEGTNDSGYQTQTIESVITAEESLSTAELNSLRKDKYNSGKIGLKNIELNPTREALNELEDLRTQWQKAKTAIAEWRQKKGDMGELPPADQSKFTALSGAEAAAGRQFRIELNFFLIQCRSKEWRDSAADLSIDAFYRLQTIIQASPLNDEEKYSHESVIATVALSEQQQLPGYKKKTRKKKLNDVLLRLDSCEKLLLNNNALDNTKKLELFGSLYTRIVRHFAVEEPWQDQKVRLDMGKGDLLAFQLLLQHSKKGDSSKRPDPDNSEKRRLLEDFVTRKSEALERLQTVRKTYDELDAVNEDTWEDYGELLELADEERSLTTQVGRWTEEKIAAAQKMIKRE
ncbi:hypothetical protein [Endozoicomonas acroporae]|uniref:hypothetical protein n=1 Tax=Endozoicomonas acroporae TaxID=1701104 RepID=UPI003D794D2E